MPGLIELLEPLYVEHVAVTTNYFDETVRDYLATPGARLIRGPAYNEVQNVWYAFVQIETGLTIEVLGPPEGGGGPIAGHIERGGGAYHLCYAVSDIEAALTRAQEGGARVVSPPKSDPAHDGRPVAFLLDKAHGLVEIAAAYPVNMGSSDGALKQPPVTLSRLVATPRVTTDNPELLSIFKRVLKKLSEDEIRNAKLGMVEGWDSLAQLQLIMDVERLFKLRIPMAAIEKLNSYRAFANFVSSQS